MVVTGQSDIAKLEAIAVRNAFKLLQTCIKGMSINIHLVGCGEIIPSQDILTISQDCRQRKLPKGLGVPCKRDMCQILSAEAATLEAVCATT
jgi:hypothetical protein